MNNTEMNPDLREAFAENKTLENESEAKKKAAQTADAEKKAKRAQTTR